MPDTVTTAYGLTKPEIGASEDTWGEKINTDLDTLDTVVNAIGGKTAAGTLSYADSAKLATTATGVDVTGNVAVSGTVDGVDIAARDAVLTSTTATADAALPKAGGTMTGNITFGDNDKAIFGAGSDLQIYHDGSASYIDDAGAGRLNIRANDRLYLRDTDDSVYAVFYSGGGSFINHNGNTKLSTTATGVDITGTAVTDGLTVAGNVSVDGGTIKLDGNYPVGSDNVALGDAALDSGSLSGGWNVAVGTNALTANTTGNQNVAVGSNAADGITTGANNVSIGRETMGGVTTGDANTVVGSYAMYSAGTDPDYNTAIGNSALAFNQADNNTAVGYQAGYLNTTAESITAVGHSALYSNTTGDANTALGRNALYLNTTGGQNVASGLQALYSNTTGSYNTATGREALFSNTTASNNTAVGYQAGYSNTTGTLDAFGAFSLKANTTGSSNTGIGRYALVANTTGSSNVAIGQSSLVSNTTASNNTAVGYQAGYAATTGTNSTFLGSLAGATTTTSSNQTLLGHAAGRYVTGDKNTFVGANSGDAVTTGSNNTIIGRYNGNQGGLDIRTSSSNIVLSDGGGNPKVYVNSAGDMSLGNDISSNPGYLLKLVADGTVQLVNRTGSDGTAILFQNDGSIVGSIGVSGSSTSYYTSSDYRLKENVVELTGATDRLKQLNPSRFNFIVDADTTVDGFLAHEVQTVVPEAITGAKDAVDADGNPEYQGIDQSKLVPLLVATIKELEARITALENA